MTNKQKASEFDIRYALEILVQAIEDEKNTAPMSKRFITLDRAMLVAKTVLGRIVNE